jgi:hypothetical protein
MPEKFIIFRLLSKLQEKKNVYGKSEIYYRVIFKGKPNVTNVNDIVHLRDKDNLAKHS